jgi:hypothetical protein
LPETGQRGGRDIGHEKCSLFVPIQNHSQTLPESSPDMRPAPC